MHVYLLVALATLVQFILGALWYSLIFGKQWMVIMEAESIPKEDLQKMQKEMMPFYGLQILLTFFTTVSFANLVQFIPAIGIYHLAFWIWIGFIVPVQIGAVIWANTKKKFWLMQIAIMTGYQLVAIMLSAFILSL